MKTASPPPSFSGSITPINLVSLNSATPGTIIDTTPITGFGATESFEGIDFRPANGVLYPLTSELMTNTGRLYTINTTPACQPLPPPSAWRSTPPWTPCALSAMPKGQALGTVATMNAADNYGFVAETIGMFRVGSTAFPLTSTRGENFSVGTTGDLRLREYVVPTAGWDGSPTGQRKIGERKGDPSAPFFAHGRHPETVLHNGVFTTAAMLSNFLMIAGAAVLSVSLRSFRHPIMQKLGAIGVLATSFLFGYLLTENWVGGVACASIWLLLPWLELLTRIRRLTLPLERLLNHQSPPNSHRFPALGEITEEVEGESFEHVDDAGWEWDQTRQFFRLFYKADERAQAAICLVDQREVTFYYLSLSSRASDGTIWTTWNYPFSYSLKLVPQWRVNRLRGDQTFLQLLESHRSFLLRNGIAASTLEVLDAQRIPQEIQRDLRAQIAHNVSQGVLTETGSGEVRYSWRGLFFLWVQFLRDLVRIS